MADDQALALLMKVCATVIILIFANRQKKEALRMEKDKNPILANLAIASMCIHYVIIIAMWFR